MLLRSARRWMQKATFTTSDIQGGTNGGLLSPDQADKFLRLVTDESVLLKTARQEKSNSPSFLVPRISLHGVRILQAGVIGTLIAEGGRVPDAIRKKPATALMTLNTTLFKGEVLVSDETFEDNIEQGALADTLATQMAEAVGRDVEEIAIKSDTVRIAGDNDPTAAENALWDQFAGIRAKLGALSGAPAAGAFAGQTYNASGVADVEVLLRNLVENLPARYRRDPSKLRIWVPIKVGDAYVDFLTSRGTPLGDTVLEDGSLRPFRGVKIIPVPLFTGTGTVNSVSVPYDQFAYITYEGNLTIGWHRQVRFERFRDPREGATSFLVTVRFAVDFSEPEAIVWAKTIDTI